MPCLTDLRSANEGCQASNQAFNVALVTSRLPASSSALARR
ncbi:hypothetical protein HMPREF9004_0365 [Schaalia cardiffensis F0333]|uniref:Uncharacterized protein n=1 Tax=Schaalia cardiffensis F0333 TaxID=888050 RepID=N6W8Y8_9ACTO|nr:hypothetical protein HMPREF9004_0365 [Schaalia cardiffensis F0333]